MTPRRYRLATLALAAAAAAVAVATWLLVFPHFSTNHDEAVYLQQAGLLLEGRLFLRPPVEDVFHPWFFVADGDRLYSKYAPVPAAIFALGEALGHYRLSLAGVAAGYVALTAAVARELFDERTGVLAGAFVLCSPLFVLQSGVFLPYLPTALLNAAFALAYLRADRIGSRRWAALAGAAVGLAFFARPYTAVLFAAPFVAHACWTLRRDPRRALPRQATTAALGLAGVGAALGYNAVVTGSPLVFPYQAFAPLDGIGFGTRRLLGYEREYTPALALRANARVLQEYATSWVAGGAAGTALAIAGVWTATRRGVDARVATLAGVVVTVAAGNVYFWGNLNILGAFGTADDGFIAVLGPHYHVDLLLPTAAFAARGAVRLAGDVRRHAARATEPRAARALAAVVLLAGASAFGAVTAADLADPVEHNRDVSATYDRAYAPFEDGPPAGSLVLLPDPYGPWLNHPFQELRNDPGYDGDVLYALDTRPFAVADAFPDRDLYRYGYRGGWAPSRGAPEAARLQPVDAVDGTAVTLDAEMGVPAGAQSVSVRVEAAGRSAYLASGDPPEQFTVSLAVRDGRVRVTGDGESLDDGAIALGAADAVTASVFVDYGPAGGFTYQLTLPVDETPEGYRALTPVVEYCRASRTCGGAATLVPSAAPAGVHANTTLSAS